MSSDTSADHFDKICKLREEASRLEHEDLVKRIGEKRRQAYDDWIAGYPGCMLDQDLAKRVAKVEARLAGLEQIIDERIEAHELTSVRTASRRLAA